MKPPSISLASVPEIDRVWGHVSDGLERACQRTGGSLTAHYLWSECRSGAAFLVVITGDDGLLGASVWRFEDWSSGRKLKCLALYGRRMRDWLEQHRTFSEQMARAGGATALVTEGRLGWQRVFPKARLLSQSYEVSLNGDTLGPAVAD